LEFNNDITIIVGDNGIGKTTLLKMLQYKKHRPSIFDNDAEKIKSDEIKHFKRYIDNDISTLTFEKLPQGIFFIEGLHKNIVGNDLKNAIESDDLSIASLLNICDIIIDYKDISLERELKLKQIL